jgi:hypothetical protein
MSVNREFNAKNEKFCVKIFIGVDLRRDSGGGQCSNPFFRIP